MAQIAQPPFQATRTEEQVNQASAAPNRLGMPAVPRADGVKVTPYQLRGQYDRDAMTNPFLGLKGSYAAVITIRLPQEAAVTISGPRDEKTNVIERINLSSQTAGYDVLNQALGLVQRKQNLDGSISYTVGILPQVAGRVIVSVGGVDYPVNIAQGQGQDANKPQHRKSGFEKDQVWNNDDPFRLTDHTGKRVSVSELVRSGLMLVKVEHKDSPQFETGLDAQKNQAEGLTLPTINQGEYRNAYYKIAKNVLTQGLQVVTVTAITSKRRRPPDNVIRLTGELPFGKDSVHYLIVGPQGRIYAHVLGANNAQAMLDSTRLDPPTRTAAAHTEPETSPSSESMAKPLVVPAMPPIITPSDKPPAAKAEGRKSPSSELKISPVNVKFDKGKVWGYIRSFLVPTTSAVNSGDPFVDLHEYLHFANSDQTILRGQPADYDPKSRDYRVFLTEDGIVSIKNSNHRKGDAREYVPKSLDVKTSPDTSDCSVYFGPFPANHANKDAVHCFDDMQAYLFQAYAVLESKRPYSGIIRYTMFFVHAAAVGMLLEAKDDKYWNSDDGKQFKAFLARGAEKSMAVYRTAKEGAENGNNLFREYLAGADEYINNLRTSPDAEKMRQFFIRTYGKDWTHAVLGFQKELHPRQLQ